MKNIIDELDMKSLTKLLELQENEGDSVNMLNIASPLWLEVFSFHYKELITQQTNSTESNQKLALKRGKYSSINGEEKNCQESANLLLAQICRLLFGITRGEG